MIPVLLCLGTLNLFGQSIPFVVDSIALKFKVKNSKSLYQKLSETGAVEKEYLCDVTRYTPKGEIQYYWEYGASEEIAFISEEKWYFDEMGKPRLKGHLYQEKWIGEGDCPDQEYCDSLMSWHYYTWKEGNVVEETVFGDSLQTQFEESFSYQWDGSNRLVEIRRYNYRHQPDWIENWEYFGDLPLSRIRIRGLDFVEMEREKWNYGPSGRILSIERSNDRGNIQVTTPFISGDTVGEAVHPPNGDHFYYKNLQFSDSPHRRVERILYEDGFFCDTHFEDDPERPGLARVEVRGCDGEKSVCIRTEYQFW